MAESIDIAQVIKSIQDDVTTIVRGEIALAKDELKAEVGKAGVIAGLFAGAGYLAISALAVVFSAFGFLWAVGYQHWFGLDLLTSLFWGFLTMAVVMLLIAALLGFIGTRVPQPGAPTQTIASVTEQVESVKSAVREANAEISAQPVLGAAVTTRPELD